MPLCRSYGGDTTGCSCSRYITGSETRCLGTAFITCLEAELKEAHGTVVRNVSGSQNQIASTFERDRDESFLIAQSIADRVCRVEIPTATPLRAKRSIVAYLSSHAQILPGGLGKNSKGLKSQLLTQGSYRDEIEWKSRR